MKQVPIVVAARAVLLAGCGSEPGEFDIEAAKGRQADLEALKVIGCKEADSNGGVRDRKCPSGGGSVKLVKGDAGWVFVGLDEK